MTSEIEKQLQMWADIEAVKKVQIKYLELLDSRQIERMSEIFTEDATADFGGGSQCIGLTEIKKYIKEAMKPYPITKHTAPDPHVEIIDDNKAKGVWSLLTLKYDGQSKSPAWGAGYYNEELIKIEGKWKIEKLVLKFLYH